MENKLEIFNNSELGNVRVIVKDGEPFFVAKDVCDILGLKDVSMSLQKLDNDEKLIQKLFVSGQNRDTWTINESGLYSLILRSNKPQAKQFKKWVTGEVLPTIRKHGAYLTDSKIEEVLTDPDTIIKLATQLKEEREARKKAETKVVELKPKAAFADAISSSNSSVLIGEFAKIISNNDFKIGQNKLFAWLRENGYLMSKGSRYNQPYQKYIENGYFEIIERVIHNPDGTTRITVTTKITGKGQVAIFKKLKKKK
jgi:anti-repressor protein